MSPGRLGELEARLEHAAKTAALRAKVGAAGPDLAGTLRLDASGRLALSVPNALARGLHAALDEPGAEASTGEGAFDAHILVMTSPEAALVGPDAITERGKSFAWRLGPCREVEPAGRGPYARVWSAEVVSPELARLRRSYGLQGTPEGGFRVDFAARRRGVLGANDLSKGAAVDWDAVRSQLPHFHAPDAAIGAAVGGLGGAVVGALRGPTEETSHLRRTLEHAGIGAALGGVAGNVVGDRTRRYISNTKVPWGYDGNVAAELRPKSPRQFVDAAIADKPTFDESAPDVMGKLNDGAPYSAQTWKNYYLPARRELMRRTLGVHTDNPATDFWARGRGGDYTVNPARQGLDETLRRFSGNGDRPLGDAELSNPSLLLGSNAFSGDLLSDAATGNHRVATSTGPGGKLDAEISDRWDFDLHPDEQDRYATGLTDLAGGRRPREGWATLALRHLLDRALSQEKPVIRQPMRFDQSVPSLQYLRHDGAAIGSPVTASS